MARDCIREPGGDMIDHTAVNVSDQEQARSFYTNALEPLGYSLVFEQGEFMGFADSAGLSLGVVRRDPVGGAHVAFKADNHGVVDAFYAAAMATGGTDNGPPGIRAHYHENYYAAFVHDADGNNIEAVCQAPQ
jgi:catechol 2,3-dioxygenase-like lactoylglutathione lyase family enzyme